VKLVHHIIESQAFRWNWLACFMRYVNCIINYLSKNSLISMRLLFDNVRISETYWLNRRIH
jgi:hypothetical protein